MLKKYPFLPISAQKARTFANFLQLFAYFCLTHFNTCAFARAKNLINAQKPTLPPKNTPKIPPIFIILDNFSSKFCHSPSTKRLQIPLHIRTRSQIYFTTHDQMLSMLLLPHQFRQFAFIASHIFHIGLSPPPV